MWYVERMKFLFDIIVHKKTKKKSKVNVTKFKTGPFLSFTSFLFCKDYFHSYYLPRRQCQVLFQIAMHVSCFFQKLVMKCLVPRSLDF